MSEINTTVSGYTIKLKADEDGRLVATSHDFPELATDGSDIHEALVNAADALDVVIRDRLRRGEVVRRPHIG